MNDSPMPGKSWEEYCDLVSKDFVEVCQSCWGQGGEHSSNCEVRLHGRIAVLTGELAALRAEVERLKAIIDEELRRTAAYALGNLGLKKERDVLRAVVTAAKRVCQFDWSDNDDDAAYAVRELSNALASLAREPTAATQARTDDSALVERVARAIYEATYAGHPSLPAWPLSRLDEENQEKYRAMARAAIGAMA